MFALYGCAGSKIGQSGVDPIPELPESSSQSPGMPVPSGSAANQSVAQLQLEVMDFSDLYTRAISSSIDQSAETALDAATRASLLAWNARSAAAAIEIAAGADPRTNLLDMAIFVSAAKWSLEAHWIPDVWGNHGDQLLVASARMDQRIWELVEQTLTPEQTTNLRALVDAWTAKAPPAYEIDGVRFRNLDGVEPVDFKGVQTARGLLASVRRWLGNVESSLLLGERVMFYLGRSPQILDFRSQVILAEIASDFPITTIDPDFTFIENYLESLPGLLQGGIEHNHDRIREVLPEVSAAIEEANLLIHNSTALVDGSNVLVSNINELAPALDTTISRVEALTKLLLDAGKDPQTFNIALGDVAASLTSLENSISGLNALLAENASGESKVSAVVREGDRMVDQIFSKAIVLLGVFFAGIVIVLLVARRLFRPGPSGSPSPSPARTDTSEPPL